MAETRATQDLKILLLSDIEGRHDLVQIVVDADLSAYDCVIYKGDTPDATVNKQIRKMRSLSGEAWEKRTSTSIMDDNSEAVAAMRKAVEDSAKVNAQFAQIAKKLPFFGVLGNSDTVPTRIAPRLGMETVDFSKSMTMLHNKVVEFKGWQIVGYQGRVKYRDENIVEAPELMFDETVAEKDLHALFANVDPARALFVTHVPPHGILDKVNPEWVEYGIATYGDKAKDGHIGSTAFKNIAAKYQPLLHTYGHIHERPGVEKHGRTTYFNGGAMGETGEIEVVTIRNGAVECGWIKLEDL
jgi:Icc-related predicted phosphoesterase